METSKANFRVDRTNFVEYFVVPKSHSESDFHFVIL